MKDFQEILEAKSAKSKLKASVAQSLWEDYWNWTTRISEEIGAETDEDIEIVQDTLDKLLGKGFIKRLDKVRKG